MSLKSEVGLKEKFLVQWAYFALFLCGMIASPFAQDVIFYNNNIPDDVSGSLPGRVLFAQNSVIPSKNQISGDIQPHLTQQRRTMIMFRPSQSIDSEGIPVSVKVTNSSGPAEKTFTMMPPAELPGITKEGMPSNENKFSDEFWFVIVPYQFILPGMELEFTHDGKSSTLTGIEVGGFNQLVLHTIDLGFLTEPRGEFLFQYDIDNHRQYFHQAPVSQLIVSAYEPQHFTEIVLPNGTIYTSSAPDAGAWHAGSMRQNIGKVLISHGIDNANYGINTSIATAESGHPFTVAQLTAHNSVGRYSNGIQVHGGSGGNGMVTLDNSIGNEFSHEVGHNYGLGHYPGEFRGSVHRASDKTNSTWAWDSEENVFIPNFSFVRNSPLCANGWCAETYNGMPFGTDAMASGAAHNPEVNLFTNYTPYVLEIIQKFFESKMVFDSTSSTGFKKWNNSTKKMESSNNRVPFGSAGNMVNAVPTKHGVPVTTILGYYDPDGSIKSYIYPALHGSYGWIYDLETDVNSNSGCQLEVETKAGGTLYYKLYSSRITGGNMNKFHVNVETSLMPQKATVTCNGNSLDTRNIEPPTEELIHSIHGLTELDQTVGVDNPHFTDNEAGRIPLKKVQLLINGEIRSFSVPIKQTAINIFDANGKQWGSLSIEQGKASWNGQSSEGQKIPPGMYYIHTEVKNIPFMILK